MKHIIAYEGLANVSLGLMQEGYADQYLPWPNLRIGIEGTLQRPPYSRKDFLGFIENMCAKKGSHEVFAVLAHGKHKKKRTYEYVGHMGVHHISWPDGCAITGSIIGAPEGRGKGYGTEAKLLLLGHAFNAVGLRKLNSDVKAWNAASLGHLIKCGYRICGRQHAQVFDRGVFVDKILLEVFREWWEPIWNQYQKTKTLPRLTDKQRALVSKETI